MPVFNSESQYQSYQDAMARQHARDRTSDEIDVVRIPNAAPAMLPMHGHKAVVPTYNMIRKNMLNGAARPMGVLRTFMLPHDSPPLRYADKYTAIPTVTAQPYGIIETDFTSGAVAGALASGSMACLVSRNPLAATVIFQPNLQNQLLVLDFVDERVNFTGGPSKLSSSPTGASPALVDIDANSGQKQVLAVRGAYTFEFWGGLPGVPTTLGTGTAPTSSVLHGGYLYAGTHDGTAGIFVDANPIQPASFYVRFLNTPFSPVAVTNPTQHTMHLEVLRGDVWHETQTCRFGTDLNSAASITPAGSNNSFYRFTENLGACLNVRESGYYRLSYSRITDGTSATTTGAHDPQQGLEIILAQNRSNWSIETMNGFISHSDVMRGFRVNSVAAMMSPFDAEMYRGGRCAGRQIETGLAWWVEDMRVDGTVGREGSSDRAFDHGLYGFAKPDCDDCFALTSYSTYPTTNDTNVTGQSGSVSYRATSALLNPVYPAGGWLLLTAEVPAAANSTSTLPYPGGRLHLSFFWAVEYTTADPWVYASPPDVSVAVFDAAVAHLRSAPQWHENKMHVTDIINFLKGIGKQAWKMAPSLLSALSVVNPEFAPVSAGMRVAHDLIDKAFTKPQGRQRQPRREMMLAKAPPPVRSQGQSKKNAAPQKGKANNAGCKK